MEISVGNPDGLRFSFASAGEDEWGFLHFQIAGDLVSDPNEQILVTRFEAGLQRSLPDCGRRILDDLGKGWPEVWFDLLVSYWGGDEDFEDETPIDQAGRYSVLNNEECFDFFRIFLVEQPERGVETYLLGPTARLPDETKEDLLRRVQVYTLPYGSYRDFVEAFSREMRGLGL